MILSDLKNKRITVMGLGLNQGGEGAVRFLAKAGAKVLVTDLKTKKELGPTLKRLKKFKIKYILGWHREKDFIETEMIIVNPAVPKDSKYLKIAKIHKIPIETDLGLFLKFCSSSQIIGVAGTKGKSTTASLIYQIFKTAKKDVVLAGNIRFSVLDALEKIKPKTIVVLEISSWQLEGIKKLKWSPKVAVLTNILPDHLDRYKSFKDYAQAEKLIYKFQKTGDFLVTENKVFKVKNKKYSQNLEIKSSIENCNLMGVHNLANILLASLVGIIYKISLKTIRKAIKSFKGLEHRLEFVREINGVKFFNDSAATTPEATLAAINSFKKNLILILGGKDKKLSYDHSAKFISQSDQIKKVILLVNPNYDASNKIEKAIKKYSGLFKLIKVKSLKEAVKKAFEKTKKGETILFSPAAASFGMFKNEFDRGNQFKEIVLKIKNF